MENTELRELLDGFDTVWERISRPDGTAEAETERGTPRCACTPPRTPRWFVVF